jgi:predicted metal-dependent peptidase
MGTDAQAAETADAVRKQVAGDILGAPGTGASDDLREWAMTELGIDRAQWYAALATAVGKVSASFGAPSRWQWPGRRDMADMGGAMVPQWKGERPSAAVIVDTSGSVGPMDLDMAVAAGTFVARVADVTFYGCNTRVRTYGRALPAGLSGGGGTDLRVGIEQAIADGAKAIVIITDAATPWPAEALHVPVIIGLNANGRGQWIPDWMTVIPLVPDMD